MHNNLLRPLIIYWYDIITEDMISKCIYEIPSRVLYKFTASLVFSSVCFYGANSLQQRYCSLATTSPSTSFISQSTMPNFMDS